MDSVPVVPHAGNFVVASENHANYATLDQVIEYSGKAGTVLLDSRMVSDYIGTTKQDFIPESGHIAGSVNYFAPLFLNPDLTFKKAKQIGYEMSLLGITKDKNVITYCNSGQFATTSWFALKEIAGMDKVSSFDGSVAEWVNEGRLPLTKG